MLLLTRGPHHVANIEVSAGPSLLIAVQSVGEITSGKQHVLEIAKF
jgi:hypothetical protein